MPAVFSRDLLLRFSLPNSSRLLLDLSHSSLDMVIAVETLTGERPISLDYNFTVLNEPGVNLIRYLSLSHILSTNLHTQIIQPRRCLFIRATSVHKHTYQFWQLSYAFVYATRAIASFVWLVWLRSRCCTHEWWERRLPKEAIWLLTIWFPVGAKSPTLITPILWRQYAAAFYTRPGSRGLFISATLWSA